MKNISNRETKHDNLTTNVMQDKQALFNAWEGFRVKEKQTKRSWANFLHYLKKNHNGNKNNYFGYKGTEIRVYGDELHIETEDGKKENLSKTLERTKIQTQDKLNKNLKPKNIIRIAGSIAASVLITIGGIKYFQEQNNNSEPNFIAKNQIIQNPIITLNTIDSTNTQIMFENTITPNDLKNAIEKTINQETKNDIINFVNKGDILGLQKYLGMKQNSKYTLNNATGIIDENTMNILNGEWFGMRGNEITKNENISIDVKDIYKKFLNGEIDNDNKPYIINSKLNTKSYLFSADHKILDIQNNLLGKGIGKEGEYLPFARYYNKNGKKLYYKNKQINRDTPEGKFIVSGWTKVNPKHYIGAPIAINLKPIYNKNSTYKYDTTKISLAMHSIFIPKNNPTLYKDALENDDKNNKNDNYQSKGCINLKNIGRIAENIKNGSIVYNTEYNKYKQVEEKQLLAKNKIQQSHKYAQNIYQSQQKMSYNIQNLISQNTKKSHL